MSLLSIRGLRAAATPSTLAVLLVGGGLFATGSTAPADAAAVTARVTAAGGQVVTYHGYQLTVPGSWRVLTLAESPHACVRFDRSVLYLGHPGDQSACPSRVIGGAPALLVEPLDDSSAAQVVPTTARADRTGAVPQQQTLHPPTTVLVQSAGVLVTASYGDRSAALVRDVLAGARVTPGAHRTSLGTLPPPVQSSRRDSVSPGRYVGLGFDTCTAPSSSAMSSWRSSSPYRSVGVYIGGNSRGCAQPQLTRGWVADQVSRGWHLVPTYVGLQAPCTGFYNRMSYDAATAQAQGAVEARDAAVDARALGMAAASTLFSDIEGYDSTNPSCVTSVRSYVSGWTRALHRQGYRSGVYSSASSGIVNLSQSYTSQTYTRPDSLWIAWWNGLADIDGGSYLPDDQWADHQRVHQYIGATTQSWGGYRLEVDLNYLDIGQPSSSEGGCPTNVSFAAYPPLQLGSRGPAVRAAQCLLSRRGFEPGLANGRFRAQTSAAVSSFKASHELPADALLGRRAWTALLSAGTTPELQVGSTGRPVRRIQRSLTAALHRPVAILGKYTRGTRHAVISYQQARRIEATGIAGSRTWDALQKGAGKRR